MIKVHHLSEIEWEKMSETSRTKAQKITPETWANSLVNLVTEIQGSRVSQ
jgi:hypothetical protein